MSNTNGNKRVLLITGASGIAEATALLAGQRDYSVFIAGIDEQQCCRLTQSVLW